MGVVVCEHADLDLLEVNCVKQCRKDRESLISLLIQSAPNTLIIALFFVMSAVTPTVKTYQGREWTGIDRNGSCAADNMSTISSISML